MGLGDPIRLAASYADRPLYLIGPALFPDYLRLLKLLVWIVVPIVFIAIFVIDVFQGGSIGSNFGRAFSTALTAGVHICFWTTLAFAIVERTATGAKPLVGWTPDMLMDVPARRMAFGELVTGVVFGVLGIAVLLLSPVLTTVTDDAGNPVGVLNPDLWEFWVPYLVVVAVLAIAFQFVTYYRGPSLPVAFGNLGDQCRVRHPGDLARVDRTAAQPCLLRRGRLARGGRHPGDHGHRHRHRHHRRPGVRLDRRVRQGAAPLRTPAAENTDAAPPTPEGERGAASVSCQVALRLPRVMRPQISSTMMAPTMAMSQDWIDQKSL